MADAPARKPRKPRKPRKKPAARSRARWPQTPTAKWTKLLVASVRKGSGLEGAARRHQIPPPIVTSWYRRGSAYGTAPKAFVDFRLAVDQAGQEYIDELLDSLVRSGSERKTRANAPPLIVQDFRAVEAALRAADPMRFNEKNINKRLLHGSMDDLMDRLEGGLPRAMFDKVLEVLGEIRGDMQQEEQ